MGHTASLLEWARGTIHRRIAPRAGATSRTGRAPGCRPAGPAGVLRKGPVPPLLCGRAGLVTKVAKPQDGRDSAALKGAANIPFGGVW